MVERDETMMRQYLLGALSEAEMASFEERLMTESDLFEMIEVIEDELIDERLEGRLSADEQDRFDTYFLSTPARRERLEFVQALRDYANLKLRKVAASGGSDESAATTDATTDLTSSSEAPEPASEDPSSSAPVIRPTRWWTSRAYVGLAAAILLIAIGMVVWFIFLRQSDVSKGLQALNQAYRQQRPTEARITGFDYAPLPNTRGNEAGQVDTLERDHAELTLLTAVKEHRDADTCHAVGLVYLTRRDFNQAIEYLDEAVRRDERRAAWHSDLGTAYLERASANRDRPDLGDLAQSLEQVNRAIELDSSLLAAYFNKALCLQRMNAHMAAKAAWEDYLKRDAHTEWSKEAERNLQRLQNQGLNYKTDEEVYQDFLAAYHRQDVAQAWRIQSQTKEMITGTMVPFQLANRYLTACLTAPSGAQDLLNAMRFAARLEKERTGDLFFTELTEFYSAEARKNAALLKQAQEALWQGYQFCLQGRYANASQPFDNAQTLFLKAGDAWESMLVEYWRAYCLFYRGELTSSSGLLTALAEDCRSRHYAWLESQARSWLANNSILLGEYSQGIAQDKQALRLAAAGDLYLTQKASSQVADDYKVLGRLREALKLNQQSLPSPDAYFVSLRQYWRSLLSVTDTLFALRLYSTAESFQQEALQLALNYFHDPALTSTTYRRLGQIYAGQENYAAAMQALEHSLEAIQPLAGDPIAQRLSGLAMLQTGNVKRQMGDYADALTSYQQAAQRFDSTQLELHSYNTHKGMLLCYLLEKDDEAIQREMPVVLDLFERNRRKIKEEMSRNHFFDAEQGVYEMAIAYEQEHGNVERGFYYAELSRARSLDDAITAGTTASDDPASPDVIHSAVTQPLALTELQARLPAGLQLIEYAVLRDRLLIWVVTRTTFSAITRPVSQKRLETLTDEYLQVLTRDDRLSVERERHLASELYAEVFAPLETLLIKDGDVVLVPDKFLFKLPFVALLSGSSGQRVVEDYTLLYAPSATVLIHCSELARLKMQNRAGERILSVGNPLFSRRLHQGLPDLPAAAEEAEKVAALYDQHVTLVGEHALKSQTMSEMQQSDVIHFATHYLTDDLSPARSKLLLTASAEGGTDEDDLTLREIQTQCHLKAKVAILSACQSGVEHYYAGEGITGLAPAFLTAGIPLVVASQWAVESESAADLMVQFHRLRKVEGLPTTLALRQAQLAALHDGEAGHGRPYYWAAFFPLGGYASY
jgi:CHAT domain-containing protein